MEKYPDSYAYVQESKIAQDKLKKQERYWDDWETELFSARYQMPIWKTLL